jgi:hypothetical protein
MGASEDGRLVANALLNADGQKMRTDEVRELIGGRSLGNALTEANNSVLRPRGLVARTTCEFSLDPCWELLEELATRNPLLAELCRELQAAAGSGDGRGLVHADIACTLWPDEVKDLDDVSKRIINRVDQTLLRARRMFNAPIGRPDYIGIMSTSPSGTTAASTGSVAPSTAVVVLPVSHLGRDGRPATMRVSLAAVPSLLNRSSA